MNTLVGYIIGVGLLLSPIILLQTIVMPQLDDMRQFYSSMDQTVQKVADGASAPKQQ